MTTIFNKSIDAVSLPEDSAHISARVNEVTSLSVGTHESTYLDVAQEALSDLAVLTVKVAFGIFGASCTARTDHSDNPVLTALPSTDGTTYQIDAGSDAFARRAPDSESDTLEDAPSDTDSGPMLADADQDGMSDTAADVATDTQLPTDDGMTLAETETSVEPDVTLPPDTKLDDVEVNTAPDSVNDESVTPDLDTLADSSTDSDVAVSDADDVTADTSSPEVDATPEIDAASDVDAADASVDTSDGSDVAVPADDTGAEGVVDDVVKNDAPDAANPCKKPVCTPVKESLTCEEGSKNVQAQYFVQCATQFICDKQTIDLPDQTTQTVQSGNTGDCKTQSFDASCMVINSNLPGGPVYCPAVGVKATPPKNTFTITPISPASTGTIPDAFGKAAFTAKISAQYSYQTSCTFYLQLKGDGTPVDTKTINGITPPATISATLSVTPLTDYLWSAVCTDTSGAIGTFKKEAGTLATSDNKLSLWVRPATNPAIPSEDFSGLGLSGKLIGNSAWSPEGLVCDGKSGAIAIANQPEFAATTALTISTKITPALSSAAGIAQDLVSHISADPSNSAYNLSFSQAGPIGSAAALLGPKCTIFTNLGQNSVSLGKILPAKEAHRVTCVYDATEKSLKLYLDNALANQIPAEGTINNSSAMFLIGGSNNYYQGILTDILLWTRALSANEVSKLIFLPDPYLPL